MFKYKKNRSLYFDNCSNDYRKTYTLHMQSIKCTNLPYVVELSCSVFLLWLAFAAFENFKHLGESPPTSTFIWNSHFLLIVLLMYFNPTTSPLTPHSGVRVSSPLPALLEQTTSAHVHTTSGKSAVGLTITSLHLHNVCESVWCHTELVFLKYPSDTGANLKFWCIHTRTNTHWGSDYLHAFGHLIKLHCPSWRALRCGCLFQEVKICKWK